MTGGPAVVVGTTWAQFARFDATDEVGAAGASPPGHVTGVAWVFDPTDRSILLVRHRTLGWSCPGGHLEPGETAWEAAQRELAEETGLRLEPRSTDPFALVVGARCRRPETLGDDHWSLGYRFAAAVDQPVTGEDGQPVRWFPLDELPVPRATDLDDVVAHVLGSR